MQYCCCLTSYQQTQETSTEVEEDVKKEDDIITILHQSQTEMTRMNGLTPQVHLSLLKGLTKVSRLPHSTQEERYTTCSYTSFFFAHSGFMVTPKCVSVVLPSSRTSSPWIKLQLPPKLGFQVRKKKGIEVRRALTQDGSLLQSAIYLSLHSFLSGLAFSAFMFFSPECFSGCRNVIPSLFILLLLY